LLDFFARSRQALQHTGDASSSAWIEHRQRCDRLLAPIPHLPLLFDYSVALALRLLAGM
jgi:hypothetical protein